MYIDYSMLWIELANPGGQSTGMANERQLSFMATYCSGASKSEGIR